MLNITIYNTCINLDLLFEKQFLSLNKYISGSKEQYYIKSYSDMEFIMPRIAPSSVTKYYDLYELSDYTIQIQKQNSEAIGAIIYNKNVIKLYMLKPSFSLEYLLSQYALSYILGQEGNALIMHSSTILYKNKGIMFSAKSGTGKSTHSRLWQKYSDSIVINDDKNIICVENNKVMIYPSPWSGKHMLDNNIKSTLDCIIFLYQSKENKITKLSKLEAMKKILVQVSMPTVKNKNNWNMIIDKLLELPIYYYGCNMEYAAFEMINKEVEMKLCL
ncbi:MAG: hypothetical protein ACI35S_08760 [Anaeroplasma sp.]